MKTLPLTLPQISSIPLVILLLLPIIASMSSNMDIGTLTIDEASVLFAALKERLRPLGVGAGRRSVHNPESWDWEKKNSELSAEHGVTYAYVCFLRRKLGKPKVCGGKHWPACKDWDWNKSDTEIAREHGLGLSTVSGWRRTLNKPLIPREYNKVYNEPIPPRAVINFSDADWAWANVEIARLKGCSREYVRQMRAKAKQPKIHFYERQYRKFKEMFNGVTDLNHQQAKAKWGGTGLGQLTFIRYCRRAGINVMNGGHLLPWASVNFKLPNKLLGEIWGCRVASIAAWRSRYPSLGRASFMITKHCPAPEAYRSIVEAERAKASAWKERTPSAASHSPDAHGTTVQSAQE